MQDRRDTTASLARDEGLPARVQNTRRTPPVKEDWVELTRAGAVEAVQPYARDDRGGACSGDSKKSGPRCSDRVQEGVIGARATIMRHASLQPHQTHCTISLHMCYVLLVFASACMAGVIVMPLIHSHAGTVVTTPPYGSVPPPRRPRQRPTDRSRLSRLVDA